MLQDLFKTALLGTDRATPSVETLQRLKTWGIDLSDMSEAVLLGIGTADLVEKSGFLPQMATPTQAALPAAEAHPLLPPPLRPYVYEVVKGTQKALFPEFLSLLEPLKARFFPEFLPDLLEAGTASKAVRAAIVPLLGARGLWLAAQNKAWHWATQPIEPAAPWAGQSQEATRKEMAILQQKSTHYYGIDSQTTAAWRAWSCTADVEIFSVFYAWVSQVPQGHTTLTQTLYTLRYRRDMAQMCRSFQS